MTDARKVGVVGLGGMGVLHAGILNALPGTRVVSMVDQDKKLVKVVGKVTRAIHLYTELEEMLSHESLDAVYVCTPTPSHYPVVKTLLSRTKDLPLFVEKPLALNFDQAAEIAREVGSAPRVTMVGYQKRYLGCFRKAREIVRSGGLGKPSLFRAWHLAGAVFTPNTGWKFAPGSGGAVRELGPHLLDTIRWFFGEPTQVRAFTRAMYSTEVEDFASVHMTFPSGVMGLAEIGWSLRNYSPDEFLLEIHGDGGALSVTKDRLILYGDAKAETAEPVSVWSAHQLDPPVPILLGSVENVAQDVAFLEHVAQRTQPESNFQGAALTSQLIDRVLESAGREGGG
jgi:predicted dehydrogenase